MPRPVVREEGRRLGHRGEALGDFVFIVSEIDDAYVEIAVRRISADVKRQADAMRSKR